MSQPQTNNIIGTRLTSNLDTIKEHHQRMLPTPPPPPSPNDDLHENIASASHNKPNIVNSVLTTTSVNSMPSYVSDEIVGDKTSNTTLSDGGREETETYEMLFDDNIVNDLYDKLKALTSGIKYNDTNWVLLASKVFKLVTSKQLKLVKNMDLSDKILLAVQLTILYLDNETNMDDDMISVVQDTVVYLMHKWADSFKSNKNNHSKAIKSQRVTQKKISKNSADIVAEETITPDRIEEILIMRIESIVKRGLLNEFNKFQHEIPELIVMSIKVVDKYSHLSSADKRELIVQTLSTILAEKAPVWFKLDDKDIRKLKLLANSLPILVETTTSLVNGEIPEKLNLQDAAPLLLECVASIFKSCRK